MHKVDLATTTLRELNAGLHRLASDTHESRGQTRWRILNPRGQHAIAVGLDAPVQVEIDGHVGYYCGGMNKAATILINGNAGQGVAENMMSGRVHVKGDVSQAAGASAHGGTLVVDGNASARCGISLKGADIIVKGSVGHMSAFMAQSGNLVVLGDAGDALGDSLYEARIYVRGKVNGLGADCIEKPMHDAHRKNLLALLKSAGMEGKVDVAEFRRFGSARKLYHFHIDNLGSY